MHLKVLFLVTFLVALLLPVSQGKKYQTLKVDSSALKYKRQYRSWKIPSFETYRDFTMESWFFFTSLQNLQAAVFYRGRDKFGLIFWRTHLTHANGSMCSRNLLTTGQWLHLIYGYDKTNSKLIVRNQSGQICEKTGITMKGTSKGIQLLRLSKQASSIFYIRKFLVWFLPPGSLNSGILTATAPDPISRTLRESTDLFFIAQRLGRFRKVYNQRKDGRYGKLFLILPESLESLAGVEVVTTPTIPTKPTEGDSLSTPNLQNRQTFEYFSTSSGEITSNWFVPTRTQQTGATIQGWIYPISLADASLKYYYAFFGLRYTLMLMARDTNNYLGCWAYSYQSTGYEKGGGYNDANMKMYTNQWQYIACVHSGINLWGMRNEYVQHISSNLGFTLNYHQKDIQFQVGPSHQGTWSWAACAFALRQYRYWQQSMHSDYLIENRFKKLDGSRWGFLGLYYQMGQRENGLIIDSSINQMHLKSGWSIGTDRWNVNTVYNIGRMVLCPHGQTRDFQNNKQCFTGLSLPRFTPTKPVMINKCGFSDTLNYSKEMWIAPKGFSLPQNTIWSYPFWILAYIQTTQSSSSSPITASKLRFEVAADRVYTDYDVSSIIGVDKWTHIAIAYRADATQMEVKVQVNGVEVDNQIYTRTSQRIPRSAHYDCFALGYQTDRSGNNPSNHYDGFMARVRVWKEFRTSGNIKRYMHDTFKLYNYDPLLKVYWKMDDTSNGWRIFDYSQSRLHVTIPATNYYEFELAPDGLILCEGHSWWDGTECRTDIWAVSRFRTTGSSIALQNLNFGRTNGYSLSFWYYQVSSSSTTAKILDDVTCTGGQGLYLVQNSNTFYGDVCGRSFSTGQTQYGNTWIHIMSTHSHSNPNQSWIWRNTVLKIHINNYNTCCYSGQYGYIDTSIFGVYKRDFALYNERMVQGDAYRLYYGELPRNIRGMVYLYRLSEGDGQGIMYDQSGSYSRRYDKASRDEFIHWLYDSTGQKRCNHEGYRLNPDSQTCEPMQVHYFGPGEEWEKVLAHMGCMWTAIYYSIIYERITYEFWLNIESLGTKDYIMGFQNYNEKKISFYWTTSGYLVEMKSNTAVAEGVATTCADVCNQWIHVVLQTVDTRMMLHLNGLKVQDKSITNMVFSSSNKYLVMGNPSNTGSFYIRNLIWWSFNGFLTDAFIRERATYPMSQTSFSLSQSLHQFSRPTYETNVAAMFWLDDDMVQTGQTYKMLTNSRSCHLFIHHHAFKSPPIYEHPDQQTMQEYPPMQSGSSFDLSIPGNANYGYCQFVFDTWIRIESDLTSSQKVQMKLFNSTHTFLQFDVTGTLHYMEMNYNSGEIKAYIEREIPRAQWVSVLFMRGAAVPDNTIYLSVNNDLIDKRWTASQCYNVDGVTLDPIGAGGGTLHFESAVVAGISHFRYFKNPIHSMQNFRDINRRVIHGPSYASSLLINYRLFRMFGKHGFFMNYVVDQPTDTTPTVLLQTPDATYPRSYDPPVCRRGQLQSGTKCFSKRYLYIDRSKFNAHTYMAVQAETNSVHWDLTIEGWVAITSGRDQGYFQDLMSCGSDRSRSLRLGLGHGGVNNQVQCEVGASMRSGIQFSVQYFKWNHYAVSKTTGGAVKVYINGAQMDSYSRSVHVKCDALQPIDQQSTSAQVMTGYATEFRVWPTARSLSQIQTTMNRRLTRAERMGTLAYYYLDETDILHNNMVVDKSPSAGISYMGGYSGSYNTPRYQDVDFYQAGWAPICEYDQEYASQYHRCQDPQNPETAASENPSQVTLQTTKGTVRMEVNLPYEAGAGVKDYTLTLWARIVSLSTSNTDLKSVLVCQRRGAAEADGLLLSTQENTEYNEVEFYANYKSDKSKVLRYKKEQKVTGGDWMYLFISSNQVGTNFFVNDVEQGSFSLYYMPLFDPQGSFVFGDCDGTWRTNSVRFSELRLWTVFKTPAELESLKFKLFDYSHADIQAEQLQLAMLMPLRNVDLNDYAQDITGVLNPVANVDDAWTSTQFYTELYGYSADSQVKRRLKEPLSLKVANNEVSIPVTNLTVANIKKGITIRTWIRPQTLNKRLARVLCLQHIFSVFVNNEGSMYLVYKAKRVGVNSASLSKWNEVFISISRKFSLLHVNDLEDRLRYKHLRTIVPTGVSSISSEILLGSSDLSKLLIKQLVVLHKPLKYSGQEFTLTDNKLLAYWRFQTQNDTLYELLSYSLKEAQDVRIAAGAVQTELVPLSVSVNTTAALDWEEDPSQDDFDLCDPGVKRNSDNSCSYGVTNFALLNSDTFEVPVSAASQHKIANKGFSFMFMFNLLDASSLSAGGSTFVTLGDSFIIKLPSTLSIKSTISGTDYATPDAAFTAAAWVHVSFIYKLKTTVYKVFVNGVEVLSQTVTPFPGISKTLFSGVGNTLLKNVQLFARGLPLTYVRHSINSKMDATKFFRTVVYYYPLDQGDGNEVFEQISREPITGQFAWFSELDTNQVSLLCPDGQFYNTASSECEATDKSLTFNKPDGSGGVKGSLAPIKTSTLTLPQASHSVGMWINPARCLETVLKFSTIIEIKLVGTELQYKSKGTKTLTGTISADEWQHWSFAYSAESYYLAINGIQVDDPRGLQSDISVTDGFIIGADAEDATSSALEASIGTITAYSEFKETSYYTSNMYNNPLFESEDDSSIVSYFQPASELTDWVSGQSVTISSDAFVENDDQVLFADGEGIYNPDSQEFSAERYLSFQSGSIGLNRASTNFTLTAWFIKRTAHDFTLTLDSQTAPTNQLVLSLSNNLILATLSQAGQSTLQLMKQINPSPAKIDDWVMVKISSHLSRKYEIIINYVSQSVSYTNTTYRAATGSLVLNRLSVTSTNVTFEEMLYYGYSIPNEAFTRDLSVHSIFPSPDVYYKFDESYGTQVLDHSIYSDSSMSPSGMEWMVELPLAAGFTFSVNDPICPAATDYYDPVAGACVTACPGGTRNNTQLICVELICLDSFQQEEEACVLTGTLAADENNKLTLTLNGNATLSQDPAIYSTLTINGDRAPYTYAYAFSSAVSTTASEFEIALEVNNTLRGYETLSLSIPRTMLINSEGHSFSTQSAVFEVTLNKHANPQMQEEISQSQSLSLLVSIVVGITIALLLFLSFFSKATKLHNAWALAYSLQLYYLLLFVNTTLPLNAESFFQGMKFFNGQVDWIKNLFDPIAQSVKNSGISDGPLNRHFQILGLTSSYFIINIEQVLYIFCLLFILSIISTGVGRCAKQADELKNVRCCERLKEAGTCNFWVRVFFSFYTSFCFFSFISLYQINMGDGGTAAMLSLANIFSVIFVFGFFIILTVALQGVVKKLVTGQKVWNKEKNFFLFQTDFDNAPRSSFAYYSLWIATRLIIAAFIVFAQRDPVAQCLFIAITSLFMGTFVMAARPFKQMVDNLIEMLEALFFAFSAVIISHIERKSEVETEESLLFYGDILIFIVVLSLGIRGVFVLSDLMVGFMGVLKTCKRKKEGDHIKVKNKPLGVIKEEPEEQALTKRPDRRPLQTVEQQFPGRHMTSSPDKMQKGRVNSTTKMLKHEREIYF